MSCLLVGPTLGRFARHAYRLPPDRRLIASSDDRACRPTLLTGSCDTWCDRCVKRTAVAAALVLPLLLGSCTASDKGPTATEAADDLAKALSGGHLAGLRFQGGTPRQAQALWSRTVAGMGKAAPRVTVGRVSEHQDGPATARLSYAWTLPGAPAPWRYDTTARLSKGPAGAWRVRLAPTLVHPALHPGERLAVHTVLAQRADILGAGGRDPRPAPPGPRLGTRKGPGAPAPPAPP